MRSLRLPARRGHIRLESGHHGDLWLDLDALCVDVAATILAASAGVPLIALEQVPNSVWPPAAGPLCAPLSNPSEGGAP